MALHSVVRTSLSRQSPSGAPSSSIQPEQPGATFISSPQAFMKSSRPAGIRIQTHVSDRRQVKKARLLEMALVPSVEALSTTKIVAGDSVCRSTAPRHRSSNAFRLYVTMIVAMLFDILQLRQQLFSGRYCGAYNLIHIVVTVLREPTDKNDVLLFRGASLVLLIQRLVLRSGNRVVRVTFRLGIFADNRCSRMHLSCQVLEFRDSRVQEIVWIVDRSCGLLLAKIAQVFMFEP